MIWYTCGSKPNLWKSCFFCHYYFIPKCLLRSLENFTTEYSDLKYHCRNSIFPGNHKLSWWFFCIQSIYFLHLNLLLISLINPDINIRYFGYKGYFILKHTHLLTKGCFLGLPSIFRAVYTTKVCMEKIEEALFLILSKANFCLAKPRKSVILSSLHSFHLLNIKFPSIHRVRGSTRVSSLASFFSGKILWRIWVCPPPIPESGFQSLSQSTPFLSSKNCRAFHHTWETSQILCSACIDTRMTVCTLVGL